MFSRFWEMLQWRRAMNQHSDWFEKHEPAQDRFEENEGYAQVAHNQIRRKTALGLPRC